MGSRHGTLTKVKGRPRVAAHNDRRAQPMGNSKATAGYGHEEVARTVMEEWARVGVHIQPKMITHGGGNEFKSRFEDTCHIIVLLQKERHISISDRPEGHSVIERFNRDIMQLIAKMCPSGKSDEAWPWIAAVAMEAPNAAIHRPMAQGALGVSPSEIMHGAKPKVREMISTEDIQSSAQNADPCTRQFVEAVAGAHNKAREYVLGCRGAYEKRLRDDIRNSLKHVKDFQMGDLVRNAMSDSQLKTMGRKKSKLHPVNSPVMTVVQDLGFGRYELQQFKEPDSAIVESSADLMRTEKSPSAADRKEAKLQAVRTLQNNTEYVAEQG